MKGKVKIFGLLLMCLLAFAACNNEKECKEDCKKECCIDHKECGDDCEKECCTDKKEKCCEDGEKCDHHKASDVDSTSAASAGDEEAHECTEECHANGCTASASIEKEACEADCQKECCKAA